MNINELYNTINNDTIDRYLEEKQEENLFLEFKTISNADFSSKDDKKNYAKALSGFANSSGGIIIWGIKAKKNDDKIDCAYEKVEIEPLSLFFSRLNELEGRYVNPLIEGIEHKKIETSQDIGYVITLIPESDSGPHMAKAGEDRYYKRSGDSFYRMEHFDIEDMFGRRKKPKLSLYSKICSDGTSNSPEGWKVGCKIILGIINEGRATAKYPYLSIIIKPPYKISNWGIDGNKNTGLPILPQSTESGIYQFGGNADIVIHPKTVLEVTTIRFELRQDIEKIDDVKIEYEIVAENFLPLEGEKVIKGEEIRIKLNI